MADSLAPPLPDFQTPPDLEPFEVLFDISEPNPDLPTELVRFAGKLGFPAAPPDRPWIYSNFVQSLDGMVTFGGNHPEGKWIAQSRHDRWMMDLLRAHADAVLYGTGSLIQETLYGGVPGGPVFRITNPDLLRLRHECLGRAKQRNIIVTASGNLKLSDYRIFQSQEVDTWIVTTPEGLARLGNPGRTRVLISREGTTVDLKSLMVMLRKDHGVRYLLCEGGPTLYGHMVRGGWMDEKFLTIAPQEIGQVIPDPEPGRDSQRPTVIAGSGFTVETARWHSWISCRKSGNHEFNRYRFLPGQTY